MLLGVHCSVSGGVFNAYNEARDLEIDCFQVFTKNQKQWKEFHPDDVTIAKFKSDPYSNLVKFRFAHASYLLNLASPNPELQTRSTLALAAEVERCHALGLDYVVFHPGAAMGQTDKDALAKVSAGLKQVIAATSDSNVMILVENTAGQGTSVGYKLEHLKEIIELTGSDRVGVCFDTCHGFAAGYDIRTASGTEDLFALFDSLIGIEKLKAFHLNDSKGEFGSRIDRHDHIGTGKIGLEPFRYIMNHFAHLPKVIETDKENDMDKVNLTVLRGLVGN
jgi:deoxyribonuclease IV